AARVGKSYTTVRYWLTQHGLKTLHGPGRRLSEEDGVRRTCRHHGVLEFVREGRGYLRCPRCRSESVAKHRRKVKTILVSEAGGCCRLCGYSRYAGALEFHHLDPEAKEFALALGGLSQSLERMRAEARKCALLCANCHAEVEGGVAFVV
ncbi:MAG: hypothetical protein QOI64_369, partial [Solirubrobacteraceae bacterium]|nr:hypothetical protein [Solirubrobacteraceae bacterium]